MSTTYNFMNEELRSALFSLPKGTPIDSDLFKEFLAYYDVQEFDTCVLEFESNNITVAGEELTSLQKPFLVKVFEQV